MKVLGNVLWLVFGGLCTAIEYFTSGLAMCLTIIGIPFGIQAFKLGIFALWPFGTTVERMDQSAGSGCLSTLMNVIWFLIGGIWIALTHLFFGLLLLITIIGIPFANQHFKMAGLALTPFGREIKPKV